MIAAPRAFRTARLGALLAAATLAGGCAGSSPREAGPARATDPAPAASAAAPPAAATSAEADRAVSAALSHVSEVRELGPKGPVSSVIISRDELKLRIERDIIADLEPEVLEGTTELLFALNLTPADFDYVASVLQLFGTQLAGFYDPRAEEMVLLDDLGVGAQEATLWHELVHALQDQNYDLERLIKWSPDRGDATAAVLSLAEGDATSAMLDVMLLPEGKRATDVAEALIASGMGVIEALPEVASVPPILKRSIVAPYVDGIAFAHALRRRGGWAEVDAAWRDVPTTTEQILHPEKYLAREPGEILPMPPPPSGGPTVVRFRDTLGEQMVRLVLEDWVPRRTAAEAASGWAGDRVALFSEGRRRAIAVRLRYDDEPSAERALEAIARGAFAAELEEPPADAEQRREQGLRAARSGAFCRERARRGPFAARRRGRDLGVTLGPYERDAKATRSVGSCGTALTWAAAVAEPGKP